MAIKCFQAVLMADHHIAAVSVTLILIDPDNAIERCINRRTDFHPDIGSIMPLGPAKSEVGGNIGVIQRASFLPGGIGKHQPDRILQVESVKSIGIQLLGIPNRVIIIGIDPYAINLNIILCYPEGRKRLGDCPEDNGIPDQWRR